MAIDVKSLLNFTLPGQLINNVKAISGKDNMYKRIFQSLSSNPEGASDILGSVVAGATGSALTGAQREANQVNIEQAREQREFEERMSNTTYQRTVQDMQNAGLNPAIMLAGGASGVSTPSGSTASSVSPSQISLSDIMSLLMLPAQIANLRAQANKTNVEANSEIPAKIQQILSSVEVNKSMIRNTNLDSDQKEIVLSYLDEQQAFYTASLGLSNAKIQQEIQESAARVAKCDAEIQKLVQDVVESEQRVRLILAQENLTNKQIEEIEHTIKEIDAKTTLIYKQSNLTQKDINWYAANHVVGMVDDTLGAAGAFVGGLARGAKKLLGRK